jgi:beta-lactamase superfamily II metal-dependent hydrolase
MKPTPPQPNELEVSIFGPGFGEGILIHVGQGKWIAIDSCVDSATQKSVLLKYLQEIGVDPATSVELVVASHWHQDHVRGLHEFLDSAPNADFCCSSVLTTKEFISLADLASGSSSRISMGPEELYKCLQTCKARMETAGKLRLKYATTDRILWQSAWVSSGNSYSASLNSLSPSDEMTTRSHKFMVNTLAALKNSALPPSRILASKPNDVSVALVLTVNERRILLGSDLEEQGDALVGWSAVLETQSVSPPSQTFKVAHHGSASGHHDGVWTNLLHSNPLALLTPFRWGKHRLPNAVDRARILAATTRAYITADPNATAKPPKSQPKVQAMLASAVKNRRLAIGAAGHIRWRAPLDDSNAIGTVELFESAMQLSEVV